MHSINNNNNSTRVRQLVLPSNPGLARVSEVGRTDRRTDKRFDGRTDGQTNERSYEPTGRRDASSRVSRHGHSARDARWRHGSVRLGSARSQAEHRDLVAGCVKTEPEAPSLRAALPPSTPPLHRPPSPPLSPSAALSLSLTPEALTNALRPRSERG